MRNIVSLVCFISFWIPSFAQPKNIEGNWLGTLNVGVQLRLVFHFTKATNGILSATMDSPDQGVKGIACSSVILKGDSVLAEIAVAKGSYSGLLLSDSVITGSWKQGAGAFALTLIKVNELPALNRPQTPKPPFNYNSEEIGYDNADKTVHVAGTFTYPKQGGPFPTAILITGSGQQDRDETLFEHKPFAVIADALTRQGFAVLRVDDRGVGKSTGDILNATSVDFAKDVEAGLTYLKTRTETDKNKMGLIGHSEGGLIAALVASKNRAINFIVMLAGPGTKGSVLLGDQAEGILQSQGVSAETAKAYRRFYGQLIDAAANAKDTVAGYNIAWNNYQDWKKITSAAQRAQIGYTDDEVSSKIIHGLIAQLSQPWLKYFISSDPIPLLQDVQAKVLALNGEKDLQVLPKQNLAGIKAALQKSKSKVYLTKELAGLNHLFQTCKACTVAEYGQLEETFSPLALHELTTWLSTNVQGK
jgi:pimeloyl-ACP methyl ester carboxylesterase